MESLFLISLIAIVACGALGSRKDPPGVMSRLMRLRQMWLSDRGCHATTCVTRVMMRGGKTRPVLECKGRTAGCGVVLHAWQEHEHGSRIEVLLTLTHIQRTTAPYSIRVDVREDGAIAWQAQGDESRAMCELASGWDGEIVRLIRGLGDLCGAASSTLQLSGQREVTWRCGLDLDAWDAHELVWSRLVAWLMQLAQPAPHPLRAPEHERLPLLVHALGRCTESLASEVAGAIMRRGQLHEAVTMCVESERDQLYLRRLLRAWRAWPDVRATLSSGVLAHEGRHDDWPGEERSARQFAAHRLEEDAPADVARQMRWFVRAAHPSRAVPQRVAWCVAACEALELATTSCQEALMTCASSLQRLDELVHILQAFDVTPGEATMRALLDHVTMSDADIEEACLEVLINSLDRDLGRARCMLEWLGELGLTRTCCWLRKGMERRLFSSDMLAAAQVTLEALEQRQQGGALSIASPRRAGTLSMWHDVRGELVIHKNTPGQDGHI